MRASTGVAVGRVGVRSTVDGAGRRRGDSLVASASAQEQDRNDDGDHQNKAGDGDADGEVAWRYAQVIVILFWLEIILNLK